MDLNLILTLIERADDLICTIDGTTDQFADEVSRLSDATSAVESALLQTATPGRSTT